MAARLNPQQDMRSREAIKTTQLVKRLQLFALGQKGPQGEEVELDAAKLKAIEILLRKSLPDLSSISMELTGKDKGPIQTEDVTAAAILKAKLDEISSRAAGTSAEE